MSELNCCPGCGRHCDWSQISCGRGEEYLRAMNAGEDVQALVAARQGQERERRPRRNPEEYQGLTTDEKLIVNLRDLGHTLHIHDSRGGQQRVLILLLEGGELTQRELTRRMEIQPGSASEVIGKLENGGLIRRTPSSTDLRTANISLTEAGRVQAEQAAQRRKERHEHMFNSLSEEEKGTLLALTEKLGRDWAAHHRGGSHHQEGDRRETQRQEKRRRALDEERFYGRAGYGGSGRGSHGGHGGPHGKGCHGAPRSAGPRGEGRGGNRSEDGGHH